MQYKIFSKINLFLDSSPRQWRSRSVLCLRNSIIHISWWNGHQFICFPVTKFFLVKSWLSWATHRIPPSFLNVTAILGLFFPLNSEFKWFHVNPFLNLLSGIERLRQLESLFLDGPLQMGDKGRCYSIETLLDILLVLYDECCSSSLRREKAVSDFIEFGELIIDKLTK